MSSVSQEKTPFLSPPSSAWHSEGETQARMQRAAHKPERAGQGSLQGLGVCIRAMQLPREPTRAHSLGHERQQQGYKGLGEVVLLHHVVQCHQRAIQVGNGLDLVFTL